MPQSNFGSSVEATPKMHCGTCQIRDVCRNPRKRKFDFCCTLYQDKAKDPSSSDFIEWMRSLVRSESLLTDNYGIDDRDAPLAPNFYRWCTGDRFLHAKPTPFPWQLEVGMKIFGDACPFCSDSDWYKEIPFNCDPADIPKRLRLRKNGVCPECGRTVVNGIRKGLEHDVCNFIGVVGQRSGKCLVGSTRVVTTRGLLRIDEVVVGDKVIVNGKQHPVTAVHMTRSKKVGRLTSSMGYSIEGTPDHQVQTPNDWQPMSAANAVLLRADAPPRLTWLEWDNKYRMPESIIGKSVVDVMVTGGESALQEMPESMSIPLIKRCVLESVSSNRLVLTTNHALQIQAALLSWGIFCHRSQNKLVINQPWATRYLKRIGIKNGYIARHIWQGRKIDHRNLGKECCANLQRLLALNDLAELSKQIIHPKLLRDAQVLYASTLHGDITRTDAARGAKLLRKLPLANKDGFVRSMAISAFEDASRIDSTWDTVKFKRASRETVYDITVPGVHRFIANGMEVHNSTGTGFIVSYLTHRLLKLKNPSEFYGIKSNTVLDFHFVGITYGNARKFMWEPMAATIAESPWFASYHEILDAAAQKMGTDELYKVKDTFMFYRPSALRLEPKSPSTRTLRGSTRIGFTVDELGHFSENKELINISGTEIWTAMVNSLTTVRVEAWRLRKEGIVSIPPALAMAISSPRDAADPIMQLRKSYSNEDDSYTMLRETWKANPRLPYEFLIREKKHDMVSFWRDYGCRPPLSENAFVSSAEYLFDVVDRNRTSMFRQKTIVISKKGNKRAVTLRLKKRWYDSSVPKILALDAGHKVNAFAGAIGHLDENGSFAYDALFEIRPRPSLPVAFNYSYEHVISDLISLCNVCAIASDRWQSLSILERAQDEHDLIAAPCQLKYGDFVEWREALMSGQLSIPRPELELEDIVDINRTEEEYFDDKPVSQFIRQAVRVVDEPGKTVSKPSTGNDDVFRAAVVAFTAARIPEIAKAMREARIVKSAPDGIAAFSTGSSVRAIQPMAIGVVSGMHANRPITLTAPVSRSIEIVRRNRKSTDGVHTIRDEVPPKPKNRRR